MNPLWPSFELDCFLFFYILLCFLYTYIMNVLSSTQLSILSKLREQMSFLEAEWALESTKPCQSCSFTFEENFAHTTAETAKYFLTSVVFSALWKVPVK